MRLATPSFSPIALLSSDLPLKRNDELRPMTLRSGIFARTAINSSERPSEKYSLLGSPLVLTSGSTAIDFCRFDAAAGSLDRGVGVPAVYRPRKKRPSEIVAAMRTTAIQ